MRMGNFPLNVSGFSEALGSARGSATRGAIARRVVASLPLAKKQIYLRLPKQEIDRILSASFPEAAAAIILRRTWKTLMQEAMSYGDYSKPSMMKIQAQMFGRTSRARAPGASD